MSNKEDDEGIKLNQEDCNDLNSKIKELESRIDSLESENARLRGELTALQQKRHKHNRIKARRIARSSGFSLEA